MVQILMSHSGAGDGGCDFAGVLGCVASGVSASSLAGGGDAG